MNLLPTLLIVLLFVNVATAGDPAIMIKQKAKDIANKNNERQGLPPQYPSAAPAPATPAQPAAPTLTPEQQAMVKLNNDLAAIKATPTPEQKESLAASLRANARGAVKPSPTALKKLADDLALALAGKTLTATQRGRMMQDILAVLNNTTLPQAQLADVVADVPAVLKKAGAGEKETTAVGDDLKAIAAEVRKKP